MLDDLIKAQSNQLFVINNLVYLQNSVLWFIHLYVLPWVCTAY